MTAPEIPDRLAAEQRMNAYLNTLVTRQAQTIEELLESRELLLASMQQGIVPFLTTARDLTSEGLL